MLPPAAPVWPCIQHGCLAHAAVRAVAELVLAAGAWRGRRPWRRPARGPGGPGGPGYWLAGQGGEDLGGEVPGGQGLEQVVHGADEGPFRRGFRLAAYR